MSDEDLTLRRKDITRTQCHHSSMSESISKPLICSDDNDEMIHLLTLTTDNEKSLRPKSYGSYTKPEQLLQKTQVVYINHKFSIDELISSSAFDRGGRHLARLNTQLLEAIQNCDVQSAERLIIEGANPNATCHLGHYSACHIAALVGGDFLEILFKYGADKHRTDTLGRTPLHLAAWAGNAKQIATLLELPGEILRNVENDFIPKETEVSIRKLIRNTAPLANVKNIIPTVIIHDRIWKDSIEHNCRDFKLPSIEELWTPLHVASFCARPTCVRLLLAAGADINAQDIIGHRPLDLVGSAFYQGQIICKEKQTVNILIEACGKYYISKAQTIKNMNLPLHTAMELGCLDVAEKLIDTGAAIKSLNIAGETPLHICIRKELTGLQMFSKYCKDNMTPFDLVDKNGYTVLHAAIRDKWIPGINIALENNADITLKAKNGQSAFHAAADLGNIDVLNEILNIAEKKQLIDYKSKNGETVLFRAVIHGHLECVKLILEKGSSVKITTPGNINILHIAAQYGHPEILELLLNHHDVIENNLINNQTNIEHEGLGPIHLAVMNNRSECVKLLLKHKADVYLKALKVYMPYNAATPLHMAAVRNHLQIAKIILDYDKKTLHELDSYKWTPLHAASYYGNRDVILLFLHEGADMSLQTQGPDNYKKTSANLIVNNISKPTQFLEDIFDSYISCHDLSHSPNYPVSIDYRLLACNGREDEQMKVLEALLNTGNRFGQKRLLLHPLVESFLYLNWTYLLPFFYIMIGIYGLYVVSLNIFITSIFFYQDTKNVAPIWLNPVGWIVIVYITGILIFTQEIFYMNIRSRTYFNRFESWIKLASVGFTMILPPILLLFPDDLWPRHAATVALLLSWMELMFMLSRFPNWGFYIWMFGKVSTKVFKILLTFIFLVIGFSLSFMIQFHSHAPFENPWAAFVKTMVMMTSEFDYLNLFEDTNVKHLTTSLFILRIIFLIFLILAAIVLMNLMVSVAVNDLHNLKVHGHTRRLEKQVEILAYLEAIIYNKVLFQYLPRCLRRKRKPFTNITLSACDSKSMPLHLRNAIFEKRQTKINKRDDAVNAKSLKIKIDEIHKLCFEKKNEIISKNVPYMDVIKSDTGKNNIVSNAGNSENTIGKDTVAVLKERMEAIYVELKSINSLICKLENKIS